MRRVAALAVLVPMIAAAQRTQVPQRARVEESPAEAAIARGRLDEAEALLYAASRRRTREPSSRGELGSFLAARGRLTVGATLLQEAREFGADEGAVAVRLTQIYRWTGAWDQAATLRNPRLTSGERDCIRYLAQHPSSVTGPDTARIPFEPNELIGLGRFTITLGSTSMPADVDPAISGLVLPSTVEVMREVQTFGHKGDSTVALLHSLTIGPYTFTNVPVLMAATPTARVGLDALWKLTPTFNLTARTMTLRKKEPRTIAGTEVPLFLTFPGVSVVARQGQGPVPLASVTGRGAIRGGRWTLDVPRGVIVVER